VRNGEGTQHVIRVTVKGAEDQEMAKKVGEKWVKIGKSWENWLVVWNMNFVFHTLGISSSQLSQLTNLFQRG
jgi:hypothetical protein